MIEETANVVSVEGRYALLQTQRQSACQSCSVKAGCGTSVLSKVVGQRSSQFKVENTLDVKVGDKVVIGLMENALVKGSLLIYALPLLFMLAAGLTGDHLAQVYQLNRDLLSFGFAVAGFALALVAIRWIMSHTGLNRQMRPHMVRKIHTPVKAHATILAP